MKMTPLQQYLAVGILVLAGILYGYYQYLWKPVNLEIKKLTITRDQKQKELEEAKKIVARYAEFKKQAATVQRELEWYENRIPKKLEAVQLVEAFHAVVGPVYKRVNFQAAKTETDYAIMPVDVQFESNFQGLLDFLYGLSVSDVLMSVTKLRVTPLNTSEDITLSASMIVQGVSAK